MKRFVPLSKWRRRTKRISEQVEIIYPSKLYELMVTVDIFIAALDNSATDLWFKKQRNI